MTTRGDIMRRQEQIRDHLEEISDALTQLAFVAVEYGIYEGFLSGSDRREKDSEPLVEPVSAPHGAGRR